MCLNGCQWKMLVFTDGVAADRSNTMYCNVQAKRLCSDSEMLKYCGTDCLVLHSANG